MARQYYLHILMWVTIIFFPVSFSGSGNVNLAQLLLHGVIATFLVIVVFIVQFDEYPSLPAREINNCVLFVLACLAYFAILTFMNPYAGTLNDLMDVLRPLLYFMYFLLPFLMPLPQLRFINLIKMLFALALLTVAMSTLVYFSEAWSIVDIWKGRTSKDPVIFHFYRWSGTSGYPSDYSFFLSFFIYALLVSPGYLFGRSLDIVLLLIFGFAATMTMSRGGIATIAVTSLIGCIFFRMKRRLIVLAVFSALLVTTFIWLASIVDSSLINLNYVWGLMDQGLTSDASARYRVNELGLAIQYAVENFPFGEGAARDVITRDLPIVESLYGHYLIKWGVIGMCAYYAATLYLLKLTLVLDRFASDLFTRAFGRAAFLLILSVPLIFGLSSAIADRFKGLPFFFLIAGYCAYFGLLLSRRHATDQILMQP